MHAFLKNVQWVWVSIAITGANPRSSNLCRLLIFQLPLQAQDQGETYFSFRLPLQAQNQTLEKTKEAPHLLTVVRRQTSQ